mgnify:CR=1 FL=1
MAGKGTDICYSLHSTEFHCVPSCILYCILVCVHRRANSTCSCKAMNAKNLLHSLSAMSIAKYAQSVKEDFHQLLFQQHPVCLAKCCLFSSSFARAFTNSAAHVPVKASHMQQVPCKGNTAIAIEGNAMCGAMWKAQSGCLWKAAPVLQVNDWKFRQHCVTQKRCDTT